MEKLVVMKFGGTSVGDAQRIQGVARIIANRYNYGCLAVVISAMSQATNILVSAADNAARKRKLDLRRDYAHLEAMHLTAVEELGLSKSGTVKLRKTVQSILSQLHDVLQNVTTVGELTPRESDLILSFGERLSVQLLAAALVKIGVPSQPLEASRLIVTDDNFGEARPLLEQTEQRAQPIVQPLLEARIVPVITGFIGATADGVTTTMGRGGSDYSATIMANSLDADEAWIYTDVDGAMTADPRIIPEARTILALTYEEAAELSFFGAKVLHPLTMIPASLKDIPIWIKNTFNPDAPGTRIARQLYHADKASKAISSLNQLSLITLQGKSMGGVPGIAAKVFSTIAEGKVNVLLISQASSEYNISLVVKHEDGKRTARLLHQAFSAELAKHDFESIKLEENLALLAVVGEGMKGSPGTAGQIFTSLGAAGVNIVAIAQGSSELNISFVVSQTQSARAVKSIHKTLKLDQPQGIVA